jgi:hypothetical protein
MRRLLSLALLAPLVLTGCGPKTHLDLQLRPVSITVARIVTPAVTLVPPATAPVPVSLPPAPPLGTFFPPASSPPPAARPVPPAAGCPAADEFAVPAKPATPSVVGLPPAGSSVQNAFGSYAEQGTVGPLNGLVDVTVTHLPSSTTSVGQRVDSWSVERLQGKAKTVELYQRLHPAASPAATAPGIYLVGLAWDDPVRGRLRFQPTGNGLQVLPDPVQVASSAAQYAGAATDPDSLTTLTLVRNVTGRKRVDACGQLIDTYTAAMTGLLVSPSQQLQVSWTQQLATAYGASDVESTLTLTSPVDGFTWTQTLRNTALPGDSR